MRQEPIEPGDAGGNAAAGPASTAPERAFFHPAPYPRRDDPEAMPTLSSAGGRSRRAALAGAIRAGVGNWPVAIPLLLFTVAAMIVPTLTNIATTDDWGYTRSVEILYWDIRLTIFPVVAATAVGQVLWGGLFALIFGMELGVMRLATVVMVAVGAVALFAILRQVGASRGRSAIGMALYLFNPLTFVLSFTFMTDPHLTSLLLISLALYLRGLKPDAEIGWLIVLGSIVAGYAFLVRQQGALLPLAVVLWLVASRRLPLNGTGLRRGVQVAFAPFVMLVGYYVWLRYFNDVPDVQQNFFAEVLDQGWEGTWLLVRRLGFYVPMYLGVLLLPIAVALLPGLRERAEDRFFRGPVGYWLFLLWSGTLLTSFFLLTRNGRVMPYMPQFVGPSGFGPPDVQGSRRRLVEDDRILFTLTIAAIFGAILLGLFVLRRIGNARQVLRPRLPAAGSPENHAAGMVAMVAFWQFVGMLPPSYHYLNRGISLDRYLLPLIPLAIVLLLWAVRDIAIVQPAAWVGVALFAVVSTAGTRDYLVFMDAVWDMARYANTQGIANTQLDAGSGWDGYHLYTKMLDEGITASRAPRGSPWWLYFYAKPTDATYVVSTNPAVPKGYIRVAARPYDQWLEDDTVYVYLMRRVGWSWPP